MTYKQFYSLLSTLSCGSSVESIVNRVKSKHPEFAADAKILLEKYVSLCDKKEFRPGNGYVDLKAAKKAYEAFNKNGNGG